MTDVDWIDLTAGADAIRERILSTTRSRLPVGEESPDNIIGVVTTRELLAALLSGKPLDLLTCIKPLLFPTGPMPSTHSNCYATRKCRWR